LYALDHNVARLRDDHARAEALADALRPHGTVVQATNMIFFTPPGGVTADLPAHMAGHGVKLSGATGTTRFVLHKDVSDAALDAAIRGLSSYFQ
ncbi:MAG: low-specificity L-threonine aldolase, partial [Pseudomonadota bacterium]